MEEQQPIYTFKKTLKQLIEEMEAVKSVELNQFQDVLIDAFDGYNYEGEEEVVGFDKWCDISKDGDYEVNLKIDHEDAYELTIYITTKDKKVTVKNVL